MVYISPAVFTADGRMGSAGGARPTIRSQIGKGLMLDQELPTDAQVSPPPTAAAAVAATDYDPPSCCCWWSWWCTVGASAYWLDNTGQLRGGTSGASFKGGGSANVEHLKRD